MTIVVNCTGLYTPGGNEERDIAYLKVDYNDTTYDWLIYVPVGVNIGQYISDNTLRIQSEIDAKEAQWAAMDPKTETIEDPITGQTITRNLDKSEIVKPDFPDYYAKRRAEYPLLRDQIGALMNPTATPTLDEILEKIQEIKAKYPKPW